MSTPSFSCVTSPIDTPIPPEKKRAAYDAWVATTNYDPTTTHESLVDNIANQGTMLANFNAFYMFAPITILLLTFIWLMVGFRQINWVVGIFATVFVIAILYSFSIAYRLNVTTYVRNRTAALETTINTNNQSYRDSIGLAQRGLLNAACAATNRSTRILLATNARDEKDLDEWITHHLALGFDHIYITDHLSIVPIIERPNVTVVRSNEPVRYGLKFEFIDRAATFARIHDYDWMAYQDADEFLVLNKDESVQAFAEHFDNADAIGINWLMFGSSFLDTRGSGSLRETFVRADATVNQHIKTWIRPSVYTSVSNPHYYDNIRMVVDTEGQSIPPGPFHDCQRAPQDTRAFIAHYYGQDYETYVQRKSRAADDRAGSRSVLSAAEHHKFHNTVENTSLRDMLTEI